jgi:hypothetical protein
MKRRKFLKTVKIEDINFRKNENPEKKCWHSMINFNKKNFMLLYRLFAEATLWDCQKLEG